MRRSLPVLTFIFALAFAACSSDSGDINGPDKTSPGKEETKPSAASSGTLSFSYSGNFTGTFTTTGTITLDTNGRPVGTGAGAYGFTADGELMVFALPKDPGYEVGITLPPEARPGDYTFELDSCEQGPATKRLCTTVLIDVRGQQYSGNTHILHHGTIKITERTTARVKGTFAGEAVDPNTEEVILKVTSGSFDLPITVVKR